jgi:hypothetical protein
MCDDVLRREALRLYRRYQLEIVEALGLCPWAERARLGGRTAERVVLTSTPDTPVALGAIEELERDPRVEIGFLLFPRLSLAQRPFERFVSALGEADRRRRADDPFALAAFHPHAEADTTDPERLVPFIRRTPDPTIQLVRMSSLDRVRKGPQEGTQLVDIRVLMRAMTSPTAVPPLRERIAKTNLETIERVGLETVKARLDAIRADRDATYAALRSPREPCPSS